MISILCRVGRKTLTHPTIRCCVWFRRQGTWPRWHADRLDVDSLSASESRTASHASTASLQLMSLAETPLVTYKIQTKIQHPQHLATYRDCGFGVKNCCTATAQQIRDKFIHTTLRQIFDKLYDKSDEWSVSVGRWRQRSPRFIVIVANRRTQLFRKFQAKIQTRGSADAEIARHASR